MHTDLIEDEGFSLLEMLVVMAIMALLVGLVAPKVIGYLGGAKVQATKAQVQNVLSALELYELDVGSCPAEDQGLAALVARPKEVERWNGPYLGKASGVRDSWGNELAYKCPGEHGPFDVISYGADGKQGGDGDDADIGSWQ